jgi:hypothetical protein
MKMREKNILLLRTAAVLVVTVAIVSGSPAQAQQSQAQQMPGQQPGQVATGQSSSQPQTFTPIGPIGAAANVDADQSSPTGNIVLSSVQNLSAGLEIKRSYWQPHFDVTGIADSNSLETPTGLDWRTWTSISGGIDLHQVTQNSNLTLGYTSGGMISNDSSVSNGIIQGLNFTEKYSLRHSAISVFDTLGYLPESAFGFDGLGATTLPATGQGGAGLQFGPTQQVLTGRNRTLSNSDAVEFDDFVSGRTSLSFSGGYSLLHYFDSGLFNYGVVNARVGYNYQVTRRDTFALFYTYSDYRYDISANSFDDHTLQVSYGRLINGSLAFQIAGGPLILVPGGTSSTSEVSWTLNTNLQYTHRRYGTGVTYSRAVGGGSGAFVGARTDTVTGSITRQMSRTFTSGITGGYGRTQGLNAAGNPNNELVNYWFAGTNISEPLRATLALTASYQFQYQTANGGATCIGPTCGDVKRHMISIGLGWHERPLLF